MNKLDLIKVAAAKAEISQAAAAKAIDAAIDAAVEAVKRGERVQVIGLATLSIVEKKARVAKNPRTGEKIQVPARKVVRIKPGAKFAL